MFVDEANKTGKDKLLLTAATAPDLGRMAALDIPQLNKWA
jgi:hypothetical protein